jgi:hypothetical protein
MAFDRKEYNKQWNKDNKDKISLLGKQRYRKNNPIVKVKTPDYHKLYYKNHPEKKKPYSKESYRKNHPVVKVTDPNYRTNRNHSEEGKKYYRDYQKNRREKDPLYKLKSTLMSTVGTRLRQSTFKKHKRTEEILGCTIEFLKEYITSQFEPWMSWDNWGGQSVIEQNVSWDMDHIIPLSSAQSEEELLNLLHYTNLQPLCSYVNRFIKRDNI